MAAATDKFKRKKIKRSTEKLQIHPYVSYVCCLYRKISLIFFTNVSKLILELLLHSNGKSFHILQPM